MFLGALLWFAVLVGVGVVTLLVLAWSRSLAVGRTDVRDGVQCGACGYDGRGSNSMTCPECGADYRQAGLIPPGYRMHGWWRTPVLLLLWTLGVLIGGSALRGVLEATVVPRVVTVSSSVTWSGLTMSPGGGLGGGVVVAAALDATLQWTYIPLAARGSVPVDVPATVRVDLSDGRAVTVRWEADPVAGSRYWREDLGVSSATRGPLSASALEGLITTGGEALGTEDRLKLSDVAAGIAGTAQLLRAALQGGGAGSSTRSSTSSGGGTGFIATSSSSASSVRAVAWSRPLYTLLMVALWGYGIVRLVRGTSGHGGGAVARPAAWGAAVLTLVTIVVLVAIVLVQA